MISLYVRIIFRKGVKEVFSSRIILRTCTTLIKFSNEQSDLHAYLSSVQELCFISEI